MQQGNCAEDSEKVWPSLFGVYPKLQTSSDYASVWLNNWFKCRTEIVDGLDERLDIEIMTAPGFFQRVSVPIKPDSEQYRDWLLSKWIQSGAKAVPDASPLSVLSFIISQFPGAPGPVWDLAEINKSFWHQTLARTASSSCSTSQWARSIYETIALETSLLSRLREGHTPDSRAMLLGLEKALPSGQEVLYDPLQRFMEHLGSKKTGYLVLSDNTKSQRELLRLNHVLENAGFIVICGDRPAESLLMQRATQRYIPVFQLDAQRLKQSTCLEYVTHHAIIGKAQNLGVHRERALKKWQEYSAGGVLDV